MNQHELVSVLSRLPAWRSTRRMALGAIATAVGVQANGGSAKRRSRRRAVRSSSTQSRVSAESGGEPVADAERLAILAAWEHPVLTPLWSHTELTVSVIAGGDAESAMIAAIREAITAWDGALIARFDGLVRLLDVTDDHQEAVASDIRVHFIPHWKGTKAVGQAVCGETQCQNVYIKSEYPPGSFGHKYGDPDEIKASHVGQFALHELGHALGLGHATPLLGTNDIMGYPWLENGHIVDASAVISACDMQGLEEVFAWALEGAAPHRPSAFEIVCST